MTCTCTPPSTTPLWSPVPEYRQPTQIQVGESIDCYMKRAGSVSGLKNDIGMQTPNLISNLSLTTDTKANVNTAFSLTPGSTRTPAGWEIAVNGASGLGPLTELTFNPITGTLTGTVSAANANKNYTVLVTANDANGLIDSRSFNFYPKIGGKDDTISFQVPLAGSSSPHVTCGFGPRTPPAPGASSQHNGVDIAMVDHSLGDIVSAADGTVVKTGPATGFGNWVVVEHHDSQNRLVATTVYGHMNVTYVNVGQKVSAGQKLAKEGNAGIGSGSHLHFEIHKGAWRNPVDPMAYLNGQIPVATNNDPTILGPDGTPLPTGFATNSNNAAGMTYGESSSAAPCPSVLPNDSDLAARDTSAETPPGLPGSNIGKTRATCAPPDTPSPSDVAATIQATCAADPSLTSYDAQFIGSLANIESGLDPAAKNPTSSATGLFQMLDSTAVPYYNAIGQAPTCANRVDPVLATKAQIAFYKAEILPAWNNYVASGKTTIDGKPITPTSWSSQYSKLNQGEFMYGLVHHDGVGNAIAGNDLGGVSYWRQKMGTA